jgi:hypothetical protein
MSLVEDALGLFGLQIKKIEATENPSAAIGLPANDDGSTMVTPNVSGSYYGVFMDLDGVVKNDIQQIQQYRTMSIYPEVDMAIQDIVNEAIPHEDDKPQLDIILDELEISDALKLKIENEFKYVLSKIKYATLSSDIFRKWYVDGRLFYQVIVDKDNIRRGIIDIRPLEATKIRKIKEVTRTKSPQGIDIVSGVQEYFVYNEAGFAGQGPTSGSSGSTQGIKLSPDAVIYAPSGYMDVNGQNMLSYLHKAIRPSNQLRMMEDALVVYRIARAPERRIFYIDVGNLPKGKAEEYVKQIMDKYRNKMVYDASTGNVRDDKKYMSMLEDFWLPRRDGGKGTEITTLPGAQNLSQMDDVVYFQKKLYESLNVPVGRLQQDEGFSMGKTNEITRDELKFQKFIDKLRRKFSVIFYELLKTQLILKGVINNQEWEEISEKIFFRFQRDNYFSEMKDQDLWNTRMMSLQSANLYVGTYFSKSWIEKNILRLTDEDIEKMKEEIDSEKDDPTAQAWSQQQMMQPPMMGPDPSMMGGDPSGMPPDQGQGGFPQDDNQEDPNQQ